MVSAREHECQLIHSPAGASQRSLLLLCLVLLSARTGKTSLISSVVAESFSERVSLAVAYSAVGDGGQGERVV